MAKKPTVTTVASGYYGRQALNDNFTALRDAFDNTLSRDGSTPNAMLADLDMNSNDILNVGEIDVQALSIGGVDIYPGNTQIATTYATQNYTGNGSTTTYAMGYNPGSKANVDVYIDGVYQNQDAFNITGTNLTFTAAPPLNSAIEIKVPVNVTSLTNTDSSQIVYNQGGTGAVTTNVKAKLQEFVSVKDFGAVGDGVADDTAAIQAAIDASAGKIINGVSGENYRITSGLTISTSKTVLDLNGATITADFSSGNAVTVGNTSVLDGLGIRNGTISTSNTSVTLNGVVFKKNVRRNVQYGGLRIIGFKAVGMIFEELNWSIQEKEAPLIEGCGIGLDIHDNGNAITISGAGLDNSTSYNVRLRGTFSVTFVGGYNQNAGLAGVLLDTATIGGLQNCNSTSFYGVYFEANGASHIIGNNGRGLVVSGCYMNASGMTGALIDLNSWTGAFIHGNNPNNTSGRLFVDADAASSLINVGRQAVSSASDTLIGTSMDAFVSDAVPVPVTSLPAASLLNRGSQFLLAGTGTGADRETPWICTTTASGSRAFRRMALQPVKQTAQGGTSPYTPNLGQFQCFDLTMPATGLTINAPTGAYDDGDEIIFLLKQSGSSSAAVTWNGVYKTDLSATVLASAFASVTFRWSAGRSVWIQTGKLEWKV